MATPNTEQARSSLDSPQRTIDEARDLNSPRASSFLGNPDCQPPGDAKPIVCPCPSQAPPAAELDLWKFVETVADDYQSRGQLGRAILGRLATFEQQVKEGHCPLQHDPACPPASSPVVWSPENHSQEAEFADMEPDLLAGGWPATLTEP